MKNKIICLFAPAMLLAAVSTLTSCGEWNDPEALESEVRNPWEQDPALWAEYTAALRDYKLSAHFITYARLHNSPALATSEQDFMRCLPDSLDIVSLTNADNFSRFDAEDMAVMREKGTRVLYQVDYASRSEEFADAAALGAYLDGVVAAVATHGLDGYSFTGVPRVNDPSGAAAAALIVSKLAADADKLLVFEGNPLFVAADDHAEIDYFVLDTENIGNVTDLKLKVLHTVGYDGVPAAKLLLAAESGFPFLDGDLVEWDSVEETARHVIPLGPLAGLGVYNIGEDYYHTEMNYSVTRRAIQTLNPSK